MKTDKIQKGHYKLLTRFRIKSLKQWLYLLLLLFSIK